MINRSIREYYLLTALHSAASGVFAATYSTFLLHKGLNLFEINLVNFVFFATLFLCEIPTGAFADVFGRKASFVTSCVLLAMGMLIYTISNTFAGFAAAEMIGAIGLTFTSGAFKAWFVDKIRHHGYQGRLEPIFAKVSQVKQGAKIIAGILGAFLADISMTLPWFTSAFLFTVTGIIACFLKEEYFIPEKFSWKNGWRAMKQTVRSSIQYGLQSSNVRFVLVIVCVQIFATQGPNMQWQPFFAKDLPGQTGLGFLWAGMMLSLMLGAWLAPILLRKVVDERKALAYCQLAIGLGIATMAMTGILPLALIIFFGHEVARGTIEPLKDAYLHDNIPSKERATIDSFESLAHHGGGMIGLLVSGALALRLGIPWTWGISGIILIVTTLLVMKNGGKSSPQK